MANKIKAIIFDMDGVLWDSMPNHTIAWSKAMEYFGINIPAKEFYHHEGRNRKGTINCIFNIVYKRDATNDEIANISKRKSEEFEKLPKPKPMNGALELLIKLKEDGYKLMIVTGSSQDSLLNDILTSYKGIFSKETIISGKDVVNSKPHPEPYLLALQRLGIKACESIVIENAPLGIQSGVAAGIYAIAVNTGKLSNEVLYNAGAKEVYESLNDIKCLSLLHSYR